NLRRKAHAAGPKSEVDLSSRILYAHSIMPRQSSSGSSMRSFRAVLREGAGENRPGTNQNRGCSHAERRPGDTKMNQNALTRRAFLAATTTTAAAAAFSAPNTAEVVPGKKSPNETLNIAAIGAGGK